MNAASPSDRQLDPEMEAGLRLHLAGRFAEAEQIYRACLSDGRKNAELQRLYGVLLLQTGRPLQAIPLLTAAMRVSEGDLGIRGDLGLALAAAGRDEEAAPLLAVALDHDPTYEALLSGFALVQTRLGHPESVIAAAERTFRLAQTPSVRIQAVRIMAAAGAPWRGVEHLLEQDQRVPLDPAETQALCEMLRQTPEPPDAVAARAAFEVALRQPDAAVDGIASAFCAIYREDPAWFQLRSTAMCEQPSPLLNDLTFIRGLEAFVVVDPVLEQRLTRLRSDLLLGRTRPIPPRLLTALARQCLMNEHAWSTSEHEEAALRQLAAKVSHLKRNDILRHAPDIALLATYRPIWALPHATRLAAVLAKGTEPWPEFAHDLIVEPARTAALARQWFGHIGRSSGPRSSVSRAVANQYEQNPYPRWVRPDLPPPLPMTTLAQQSGARHLPERPTILVAGCGTGRHAIRLAARHPQAHVVALDLSATSLAYGRVRSDALDMPNIEFRQGDILALEGLGITFDFVECSGVLHHMQDPAAGLRSMVRALSPDGAMGLGLYSRRARACLDPSRNVAAAFQSSKKGLRAFRSRIMAASPDAPERAALASADFYSLSGCRDLIFHVMEHNFDLIEIGALLDQNGLEFMGFQSLPTSVERAYRTRFPADASMRDLVHWDRLEQDHPAAFSAMYEFWVRPR